MSWFWVNQQKMQRAADAGALAGAVFLCVLPALVFLKVARPVARKMSDLPLPPDRYFDNVQTLAQKLEGVDALLKELEKLTRDTRSQVVPQDDAEASAIRSRRLLRLSQANVVLQSWRMRMLK